MDLVLLIAGKICRHECRDQLEKKIVPLFSVRMNGQLTANGDRRGLTVSVIPTVLVAFNK